MTDYYSAKDLADSCGVSTQVVSNWKRRDKLPKPAIVSIGGNVELWTDEQIQPFIANYIALTKLKAQYKKIAETLHEIDKAIEEAESKLQN